MRKQRTIKKTVQFSGVGLHTGKQTTVTFKPAPANTGIVFVRTDLAEQPKIKAEVAHVTDVARGTTIGLNGVKVLTVEHVLAAVAGLGIDNIFAEVNAGEAPVGDGSAMPFVNVLMEGGLAEQESPRRESRISEPFVFARDGITLLALPSERLELSYMIEYKHRALDTQFGTFVIEPEVFVREIAPARTFCFLHDVEQLKAHGLIKGGSLENAVVIGDEGILNDELRFPDEFVRHKVLDLLGDLVLLGVPLVGHVMAMKAGHASHVEFVKRLRSKVAGEPNQAAIKYEAPLDIHQICRILPHRYPFLLVDRITHLDDKTARGIKNVTVSEPYFQGHIPEHPIMPGVLILESMAQVGAVLVLAKSDTVGQLPYLSGIEKTKFRRPIYPGDRMDIEVRMTHFHKKYGKFRGTVKVDGQLAAETEITFAMPA